MGVKRRQAGRRQPLSAGGWNFMAEQAEQFSQQQRGQRFTPGQLGGGGHTFVDVRNESGASRQLGHLLGLGNPLRTPTADPNTYREANCIKGALPVLTTHRYKFVLLAQDLVANEVGLGLLTGLVWAAVNINSTVHQFATIKDSDATQLDSYWWGRARIVWSPGSTGLQTCLVELGPHNDGTKYRGKTDASHAKNATGTVSIYSGAGVAGSDTGANITSVYNPYAAIATTKFVGVGWVNDGPELLAGEC